MGRARARRWACWQLGGGADGQNSPEPDSCCRPCLAGLSFFLFLRCAAISQAGWLGLQQRQAQCEEVEVQRAVVATRQDAQLQQAAPCQAHHSQALVRREEEERCHQLDSQRACRCQVPQEGIAACQLEGVPG